MARRAWWQEGKRFLSCWSRHSASCTKDGIRRRCCALADHVVQSYHIDPDRVYVTGYSMGGAGTWDLAVAAPERFAAIAPLAGGGDESQAHGLMDLPIWAFHGAVDEVVPLSSKPEDGQCGACRRRRREADRVPEPRP